MIDYHRNFLQQGAQNCGRFSFIHILSCRFNPIRSQLETILDFWLLNICMKECELINPFTARVLACTFTWCYLFFKISQNKIWKFGQKLLLAKLGSERVKGGHTFGLLAVKKYTLVFTYAELEIVMSLIIIAWHWTWPAQWPAQWPTVKSNTWDRRSY